MRCKNQLLCNGDADECHNYNPEDVAAAAKDEESQGGENLQSNGRNVM